MEDHWELVAQLVEQRTFNAWVLGSIPSELTTPFRPPTFSTIKLYRLLRAGAQTRRRLLRGDVALRHAQHLKTHHEFAHRSRTQQWRIEVRVEVPLRTLLPVDRGL